MIYQIKRFCVVVITVFVIYCIFNSISYARIAFNWRECIETTGCIDGITNANTYIIESTGNFLTAHSTYQAFLNRVEIAEFNGCNYNELRSILYNAIEKMEKAKAAYSNFKNVADKMPKNPDMIDKLIKFDYDHFRINHGLLEPIFVSVKALLSKGDINGLDTLALSNMDSIIIKLYEVKISVEKDQLPDISLLWRLNQDFATTHLFGQYVSEILKNILI